MATVIIFLIVLAVLIFVHELGHFLAAKLFGIRVDAFAVGFGPKIISWKRGETVYSLRLIPFGGYVKIFGENPDTASISGPDSKRSIANKPRWQQAIVLVAGITFNFIFAWLLYITIFTAGVTATTDGFEQYANQFTNSRIMITQILPGSPADKADIRVGDIISSIGNVNGNDTVENIQQFINSKGGNTIGMRLIRNNESKNIDVIPVQGIVENKYAIGIAMQNVADLKLPFFTAIYEGLHYTIIMIKDTAVGLFSFFSNIFQGTANFADVAGPIGIAGIIGNAAELGFTYLMMITAIISINLGIINLIPFPALDGGRILFVAIEGIIRRRIPEKFFNIVNTVGFTLLMALMVLVTYKDIVKLFK
ncbi:MAG: RIP metalloprotease RseP [Patescibacteria group bacterium]